MRQLSEILNLTRVTSVFATAQMLRYVTSRERAGKRPRALAFIQDVRHVV